MMIPLLVCAVAFASAGRQLERMRAQCWAMGETYNYEELLKIAMRYQALAGNAGDKRHKAYSSYYLGVAYMFTKQASKAYPLFNKSLDISLETGNDTLAAMGYNALAGYESMVNLNLFIAQKYYIRALRHAKKSGNERLCGCIYGNMSEIAYVENDTSGLDYARKCYESGVRIKNQSTMAFGLLTMARQLYIRGRYNEALVTADKAIYCHGRNKYQNIGNVYMVKAGILCKMGRLAEAERYALLAVRHNKGKGIAIDAYYVAADIYYRMKRYDKAMYYCKKAIASVATNKVLSSLAETYMLMAEMEMVHNRYRQACLYLKKSKALSDKIYESSQKHLEEERKMGYLLGLNERDMAQQKDKARLSRNLNIFLALALMALTALMAALAAYFRKRNRMYKNIVEQSKEKIKREQALRARLERERPEQIADTRQKVDKDLSAGIYYRMCDLFDNECLYKDPMLDREMLAKRLDTNRTYLTQVIKEHTGKSLTQLINQYRVDEALRVLSDESRNSCSLEQLSANLGFVSKLTFFRVFKNIVGMSPHQYRITRHKVETSTDNAM